MQTRSYVNPTDRVQRFEIEDVRYEVPANGLVDIPVEHEHVVKARRMVIRPAEAVDAASAPDAPRARVSVDLPPEIDGALTAAGATAAQRAQFSEEWLVASVDRRVRLRQELLSHAARTAARARRDADRDTEKADDVESVAEVAGEPPDDDKDDGADDGDEEVAGATAQIEAAAKTLRRQRAPKVS